MDAAEYTVSQPLQGTGSMGLAPSPGAYYDKDYWKDRREYLEEKQDMIVDAEYEYDILRYTQRKRNMER